MPTTTFGISIWLLSDLGTGLVYPATRLMLAWTDSSLLRPSKNKRLQMMDGKKLKSSSRKLHGGAVDDGIVARFKKGFSSTY